MQVVLISHDHYDHLDKDSIRKLGTGPLYLTPLGYREWIEDILPGAKVIELDWFQKYTFHGVTYRLLPVQHWTKRTPFDTNRRLWGSWLVESSNRKVYFAGDSGYFPGFAEYGRKFGPMDAALLPIGAYEPRWFMSVYHMDPGEAVLAFKELRAKVFIPQQWGVFDLTDEPMDLPPKDYRKAAETSGLTEDADAPPAARGNLFLALKAGQRKARVIGKKVPVPDIGERLLFLSLAELRGFWLVLKDDLDGGMPAKALVDLDAALLTRDDDLHVEAMVFAREACVGRGNGVGPLLDHLGDGASQTFHVRADDLVAPRAGIIDIGLAARSIDVQGTTPKGFPLIKPLIRSLSRELAAFACSVRCLRPSGGRSCSGTGADEIVGGLPLPGDPAF